MGDHGKMYDPTHSINCDAQSSSERGKSQIKCTLKTEDFDAIKIKSEPEWPCPADSEQPGKVIPHLTIEKSEYEFQSSYWNWTEDKLKKIDEEDEDNYNNEDNDEDDYNDENDDENDYEDGDEDDCNVEENDDLKRPESKYKDRNFVASKSDATRKSEQNASRKNKFNHFREKRKYLHSYMLQTCPYCSIEFELFTDWNTHLEEVHNHSTREKTHFTYTDDGKAQCTDCNTILNHKNYTVQSHVLLHLPHKDIFKCKLCSFTSLRKIPIFQHIERRHFDVVGEAISALRGEQLNACAYCGKYVGVMAMVSMHIKQEHAEIYKQKLYYICPYCGEQFDEENVHKEHLQSKHQFDTYDGLCFEIIEGQETSGGRKKYRCLKCNLQLSGAFCNFTYHALTHLPHKCFKCRYCEFTHDKKWKVIKHTCKDLLLEIKNNPNLTAKAKPLNLKSLKPNFDVNNKLFICPKCGENFEDRSLWEVHVIKVHNFDDIESLSMKKTISADGENVTKCTICEKKFFKSHIYNIQHHAFTHMPYKLYKCKICKAPQNSMVSCSCKTLRNRTSILYICPQCGKQFHTQGVWNRHLIQAHDLRQPSGLSFCKIFVKDTEVASYKCSDCGEMIKESEPSYTDLLFKHASIKHLPFKCYKCDRCGESNDSKDIMLEHTSTCSIESSCINAKDEAECSKIAKCQCHVCGHLGDSEENLITHLNDVHQLETFENNILKWFCTECEFKFVTKEEILQHVLSIHLKKRPVQSALNFLCFFCPVCNAMFQTQPEWITHLYEQHALNTDEERKIEDLERDFKCLVCNKAYKKKHFRKLYHCIQHLKHKAFKCIICGAAFKVRHTAKTHAAVCSSRPKATQRTKRKLPAVDADVAQDAAENIVKKKKRYPTTFSKLRKSVSKTSFDPLKIDESNVQNFSPTTMAISSAKSFAWNKYCKYMTYACPECNMSIATSEAWHLHISRHHDFFSEKRLNAIAVPGNKKKRICDECGVTVHGSTLHVQRHKLTHMPYQAFICKICKHRSKTCNVLMYHIQRRHFKLGEFKCAICQMIFDTCYKRFEHTEAEHNDAEWPDKVCRICMKTLNTNHSFNQHMKTHDVNRPIYNCGFCQRKYYHCSDRRLHWKGNHPVEYASIENEEQKKLVVQKPVRNTKKYKSKKKVSKSDEFSDSDTSSYSSSDSVVLSKLKLTTRSTTNNKKAIKVKEEVEIEVNKEQTLLVKNEPECSVETALASLEPNKKRTTNKTRKNEVKPTITHQVKYEESIFVIEEVFKNEPRSDDDDDVKQEFITS